MAIGEVFLGAFVTVLLERLASRELLNFLRPSGIDAQLKKWRRTLLMIKAVLSDAENKQTRNEAVKEWLNDLEDLAYDLDDLVDKLNTEALQRKLMETDEESTSQVQKLFSTFSNNFSDFISERGINSELQEINDRLEDLAQQISMISLVRSSDKTEKRLQLTSVVEESEVHGREKDKVDLLKMLLEVESSDSPVSVIPIVGMGGVGKTTLAQLVYNDDRLKGEFDLMAWACVSDEFDAFRITKIILEKVSGSCDYTDLDMLQVKLKESLSKKRFLVVLDDVWNEKYGDWDILRRPFLAGKPGSKIIVTTRLEKVAEIMSHIPAYHLNLLSDNDALSLLAQHSLGTKTFDLRPDLREIGKSVVRRCQNLPLAVKSLGGLLCTKASPKEWEGVLNSEIWIAEEKSEILPALKLSYHYLPPELKQCFAYCAIFPKDYEVDKSELVYLWMAEGFLKQSKEELGNDYFDELLTRSFFQKSSANTSRFVMHDLINDLAMCVSGYKCLRLDDMLKDKISEKVRHLSFISRRYESYDRFCSVNSFQSLRTFLRLSISKRHSIMHLSRRVLLYVVPKLYCVRELSLSGYNIYELPSSIGDLRHLRYFNLSRTPLKWLPESVSTLCNLQVLILEGCFRLSKLPARMDKLINLRHLNIAHTSELREMSEGIARLTSLQTLSKLIVSKSSGLKINDLRDFSLLKGEISIEELQHVVNVQEAAYARLTNKPSLNKIRLEWSSTFVDSRNEILELDVLDALKPHENLSSLEIKFYGGAKFPSWIGDSSFSMLTTIRFGSCKKCSTLPTLGKLPLLKELSVQGMDHMKVIGTEFYGNVCDGESLFPSLENLTFGDMPQWEEWHGLAPGAQCLAPGAQCTIEIPKLRRFDIRRCPKLVSLPTFSFPSLRELSVRNCNEVVLNSMHNLTSLTQLELVKISGLTSVLEAFEQFPLKLENFDIDDCEDLVTLWPSENIMQRPVNLQKVSVTGCPKLLSIQEIGVIGSLGIMNCASLELLPDNISSCRGLLIIKCPSLKMMTSLEDCSTSLESLHIHDWVNLNLTHLMLSFHNYSSLTGLSIYFCDGLESFPQGGLPIPNLRNLEINGCRNLRSLPDRMEQLLSLEELNVQDCPSLTEFFHQRNIPQGGLPIPNLRSLRIFECRNLRSLPDRMEQLLSLQKLFVGDCPSLTESFQQRNIPPNLISLLISRCGVKPLGELDLHKLTSLESFHLSSVYPDLVSFSNDNDQHYLLPPSLKSLDLWNLPNLETLSKVLPKPNLSSTFTPLELSKACGVAYERPALQSSKS